MFRSSRNSGPSGGGSSRRGTDDTALFVAARCSVPRCTGREHEHGTGVCHWHSMTAVQQSALDGAIG